MNVCMCSSFSQVVFFSFRDILNTRNGIILSLRKEKNAISSINKANKKTATHRENVCHYVLQLKYKTIIIIKKLVQLSIKLQPEMKTCTGVQKCAQIPRVSQTHRHTHKAKKRRKQPQQTSNT